MKKVGKVSKTSIYVAHNVKITSNALTVYKYEYCSR